MAACWKRRLRKSLGSAGSAARAERQAPGVPGHASLQRTLAAGAAAIGLSAGALAAVLIAHSYSDYAAARQTLHDVSAYRVTLDVANVLSAERGPANSVLGEAPAAQSQARERLKQFRARSDAALNRLASPPPAPFGLHDHRIPVSMLVSVRERLAHARTEVDRLSALPLAERPLPDIQHAIEDMFGVVDTFHPAVAWQIHALSAHDPGLAAPAITGKLLADMREYGGRIASQIMAPIAARQPLPVANLVAATRSRGRLMELWQLTGPVYQLYGDSPPLRQAYADAERLFFGTGLPLVDTMIEQGRHTGRYSMTPAELTTRYVRTLQPLERLRSAFLDEVVAHYSTHRAAALKMLVLATGASLLILGLLTYLLVFSQRALFRPLLHARDEIIALAEERALPRRAATRHAAMRTGEMGRLFDALGVLRHQLRERASLTAQLEHQARTDALTGLLNRRALERLAAQVGTTAEGAPAPLSLVLLDIDHFKQINDRYGHPVGDLVLQETAALMRRHVAATDVLARIGGEEFAVLLPGASPRRAAALAETLRQAIASQAIRLADGHQLRVTASFGVAHGMEGPSHWSRLFARTDEALYRAKSDGRNCVRTVSLAGTV